SGRPWPGCHTRHPGPRLAAAPSPPRSTSVFFFFFLMTRPPPRSTLFPYTTLFRSHRAERMTLLPRLAAVASAVAGIVTGAYVLRSEEHTSELQSPYDLVCRLLLEKKKRQRTCRGLRRLPLRPCRRDGACGRRCVAV